MELMHDRLTHSARGQAMPARVCRMDRTAFSAKSNTEITWLGGAGVLINSRGTTLLIDPLTEGSAMSLLDSPPLAVSDVPRLDTLLITHIDDDHFSRTTCRALASVCRAAYAPHYVAGELRTLGLAAMGCDANVPFSVNAVTVTPTPAWHNWQNEVAQWQFREWTREDACGFCLDTPDGRVWLPGDSRLLPEHLNVSPPPDVILLDFSDDSWHITLEGALKLAAAYPRAILIAIHWGTVDAPDFAPFNADPARLKARLSHPARLRILAPGEAFCLHGR